MRLGASSTAKIALDIAMAYGASRFEDDLEGSNFAKPVHGSNWRHEYDERCDEEEEDRQVLPISMNSSLGQNLLTSTYVGEITFAIVIAILGLVLFALLIGNMQTYLQSTTARLEEWRIKRTDTEQWMRHRQLPQELKQCVRRYDQYKWVTTRGVDEEALLKDLPMDLRRDIKRHLCLDLVRRVPLFDQMDELMLDAICERLKPALCTEGTCLAREGDPVNEMLFIIRGHLDSYTTNGGRTGFFDLCSIGPGDFCGEELLTWALDPRSNIILPLSTRTVKAMCEVEAFALTAEDMKFVASQFRRLHCKQLRHKFRSYSPQWRTWAACFIQAAWRRFKKRKEREMHESGLELETGPSLVPKKSKLAVYAARLAASTRIDGALLSLLSPSSLRNKQTSGLARKVFGDVGGFRQSCVIAHYVERRGFGSLDSIETSLGQICIYSKQAPFMEPDDIMVMEALKKLLWDASERWGES
ncbi:hypothetical protein Scep_015513 [Stephania cephalantha]|uniref:Cyclic nucleotide-binding domain-containing protein n=1 Tax=Stephania cephalantha TaxID=152367 RepID=A0AAP0P0F8_9MAGN